MPLSPNIPQAPAVSEFEPSPLIPTACMLHTATSPHPCHLTRSPNTPQAPAVSEFESPVWPDGPLIMRPSPKSSDLAVTRVTRYSSPVTPAAAPTAAHKLWEAAQSKWAAVAAEADADDAAAAAAAGDAGWVPAPGAGLPVNHYMIHFESDLFVGKMLVYIKGLPSSYEPYFAGKKRRTVLMLQVRARILV